MKIAIEAQRIFRSNKHGMDFVALETIRELQKRKDDNKYFVIVAPGEDYCLKESSNLSIIELKCPTYFLWEQVALPKLVKRLGVDLLHCTSNTAPLWCPVPLVLTLHDIIYLDSPIGKGMSCYQKMGWLYRRLIVPNIINKCKRVITVSDTEYQRITKYFPQLKTKTEVIHNGYSSCYHPIDNSTTITHHYLSDSTYLLCLGNTDPRKNVQGTLLAYAHYRKYSSRKLSLVLTGLEKNTVKEMLESLQLINYQDHIICTGYIPSNDLPALYNGAFAFLFPSYSEGFGIPIIEAMACGIPVITSNLSAMPEVAGPGAILINPHHPEEIAEALLHLENDSQFYKQQKQYGLLRVQHFSWSKAAQELLKVYQALL